MISVILLLIFARQLVVYFFGTTYYFSFLMALVVFLIEICKRIAFVRLFLDRIDSWFFNLQPLQYLLWLSIKFETCLSSANYFVKQLCFFLIPLLTAGYIYGLVFLLSSNPEPSLLQLVEVFIVIWVSFYLRLRLSYLNYFNLGIDTDL